MSELLRERTVHKYYRLFAAGRMDLEGVTQAWLIKDEKSNQVRILSAEPKGNKAAAHIVTGCRPLPLFRIIPTPRWSCLQENPIRYAPTWPRWISPYR